MPIRREKRKVLVPCTMTVYRCDSCGYEVVTDINRDCGGAPEGWFDLRRVEVDAGGLTCSPDDEVFCCLPCLQRAVAGKAA